jgi:phage terminase large subunit-like protein
MRLNPSDNLPNLPIDFLQELEGLPEPKRKRFLLGEFLPQVVGALWTYDMIQRVPGFSTYDDVVNLREKMRYTVVAVDPSGCSGEEDKRSDEVGIVVVGMGFDGTGYVIEDLSDHYSPEQWAKVSLNAFDKWQADCIVGEVNYGGDMVRNTIHSQRKHVPFRKVTASRGKHVRAEPVSAFYPSGKIKHVGSLVDLETQMMSFTSSGYQGEKSPDRADAMIWGITELLLNQPRGEVSTSFAYGMF